MKYAPPFYRWRNWVSERLRNFSGCSKALDGGMTVPGAWGGNLPTTAHCYAGYCWLSPPGEQGPSADFSRCPGSQHRLACGRVWWVFMELNCCLRLSLHSGPGSHWLRRVITPVRYRPLSSFPSHPPRCRRPGRRCEALGNGFAPRPLTLMWVRDLSWLDFSPGSLLQFLHFMTIK